MIIKRVNYGKLICSDDVRKSIFIKNKKDQYEQNKLFDSFKVIEAKIYYYISGAVGREESGKNWLMTNFLIAHRRISTYMKGKKGL